MAQALFITRDDIVKFTALNGNLDTDKFIQYIKIAQDIHIQNYLGTQLFNKINDDIVASTLAEPYTSLLTTYIKPMVIHWSMVEFLPYAAYTIANKGVFKHSSEASSNVEKNEIDFLIEKERDIAQSYTNRFIDYMCFNQVSFPEYTSNSNADMFPDRSADFTGWIL
jgi:hypothetical protein